MEQLFWGCFFFGVLFTLVSVVMGEILSSALDGVLDFLSMDFLNPTVLAISITVFGGVGVILTTYAAVPGLLAAPVALAVAVVTGYLVARFYIRPLKQAENSVAYTMEGLSGRMGEVITPIPATGYGEVLVRVGAGNANHTAASFDGNAIQAGIRVVVVNSKDGVLYVSSFENKDEGV